MRYLVISYDDDQQQWFYDTVEAKTGEQAEAYILALRPYVLGADSIEANELAKIAANVSSHKEPFDVTDPLAECQDCEQRTPESKLVNPIKDLAQRVAPGEPMPAGECPACGALCQEIEAQS